MILCSACIFAQKVTKGSFSVLANEKTVNVKIDYTESKIDKVPFEVFLELENKWDEAYHGIMSKFIIEANKNSDGIQYFMKKNENYQLVFKAISVSKYGSTTGNLLLLDKNENVIGVAEGFEAQGGRYGSQTNLMSDASEELGKIIARYINKQIKKAKKDKVNQ